MHVIMTLQAMPILALLSKSDKENFMKLKHLLLIIPTAVISSVLTIYLLLYSIIFIAFLVNPPMGQRVYFFGDELKDQRVSAFVVSSEFTDKININDIEINAPQDSLYMILDMELAAVDGKWDIVSDFTVSGNGLVKDVGFDRETTRELNGYDLLKLNSFEKQLVRLVFLLPEAELRTGYSMTIDYADGGCAGPFILSSWRGETVSA